ncbi:MAG: ABC transporter substrate-binding protein [Cyanobacteria bacterium J007]|nr:MAG: ABC transporter substrate-binding protein [Cyanobacteria bacterium J007]
MSVKGKRILGFAVSFAFLLLAGIATTEAAEFAAIEKRGKLIVAVKDNVRPLGFQDDRGTLQGFEIDLARKLAEEWLGSEDDLELRPVRNRDRLAVVLDGSVDLTIAQVTATKSRSRVVRFSLPYSIDGTSLVARDRRFQQLADLQDRRIAVLEGSSSIATIRYHLPSATLIGVSSYQGALSLLETGQADAFAGDLTVLTGWTQDHAAYFRLPVQLSAEPLAVVMPKGQQYAELHARVNGAIARWRRDGWLQERAEYWGLPVGALPPTQTDAERWIPRPFAAFVSRFPGFGRSRKLDNGSGEPWKLTISNLKSQISN